MNYQQIYNNIINNANIKNRKKNKIFYYENHHIKPKSIGGDDSLINMVLLTAKEHFIAHMLLCEIYPNNHKLKFAFWAMCNQTTGDVNRSYIISSRTYLRAKKEFAVVNSHKHQGKIISKKHINTIRKFMLSDKNPMKGKFGSDNPLYQRTRPQETKNRISETKRKHPERNPFFVGYYVTPNGEYSLLTDASKEHGVSIDTIRFRCKNNQRIVTNFSINMCPDLTINMFNKTYEEVGYYFISVSDKILPESS